MTPNSSPLTPDYSDYLPPKTFLDTKAGYMYIVRTLI